MLEKFLFLWRVDLNRVGNKLSRAGPPATLLGSIGKPFGRGSGVANGKRAGTRSAHIYSNGSVLFTQPVEDRLICDSICAEMTPRLLWMSAYAVFGITSTQGRSYRAGLVRRHRGLVKTSIGFNCRNACLARLDQHDGRRGQRGVLSCQHISPTSSNAGLACKKNGTSAPMPRAISSSAGSVRSMPQSSAKATMTAAASVEGPPKPAHNGMRFSIVTQMFASRP